MKLSAFAPARNLLLLAAIALFIFYPIFYTTYYYTDEGFQLWLYRKGGNFRMFTPQGRFLTDWLFQQLYSSIDRIGQLNRLRTFSLLAWIGCLPVWYSILDRSAKKEGLSAWLPFCACLYLITSPPFSVGVSWAACMELSFANTAGLLAGYLVYNSLRSGEGRPGPGILISLVPAMISLFFYQNGFGCFLLPFLLHFIATKKLTRLLWAGVAAYLLTYVLYYILFRLQLHFSQGDLSSRAGFAVNPIAKLWFFLTRPLSSAFHFTWLVNEYSRTGILIGGALFAGFAALNRAKGQSFWSLSFLTWLVVMLGALLLIYLPSLIVKEDFGSNRTLLALDMAVFSLVFSSVLAKLPQLRSQRALVSVIAVFFIACSWYNFRYQFLYPVKKEYDSLRAAIQSQYHPGITTVDFIRPPEDLFRRKYGIATSWDEFGVPSSFFSWVPASLVRQVIFEKTGNRQEAENLKTDSRLAIPSTVFVSDPAPAPSEQVLVIDAEKIIGSL